MTFRKASSTAILFTAVVLGCFAVFVAGCGHSPMPRAVQGEFTVYISGPLKISRDYVRAAGGEPVLARFAIDGVYIEREGAGDDVVLTFTSREAQWSTNLGQSQRSWVIEVDHDTPAPGPRSYVEEATNEELNL